MSKTMANAKGAVCVAITAVIYLVAFFRTEECRLLLTYIPENIRSKIKFLPQSGA